MSCPSGQSRAARECSLRSPGGVDGVINHAISEDTFERDFDMRLAIPSIAALGFATACTTTSTEPQLTAGQLTGSPWKVISVNGGGTQLAPVTIEFGADGRASGNASCNSYSSEYKLDGKSLTFGKTAATMMACSEDLMKAEQNFLATLQGVERGEIAPDGALVLHAKDEGRIVARRT
jgi:heat shock protein HslJ